jgi:6-phosphofructokinase 1
MGRECGDIAIYAGLTGGAEIILTPERPVDVNEVCRTLITNRNNGKMSSIIVKAEGVDISTEDLEQVIREKTGLDTKMVILGHIQRGGTPTARDRMLASIMGYEAVRLLLAGESNKAIGFRNNGVVSYDLADAMKMKKTSMLALDEISAILSK